MDAYTHTILAVIVTAVAYYVGRWMMWRSITITQQDRDTLRRLITVVQEINHMGITPDPNVSMAEDAGVSTDVSTGDVSMPRQLDLFLTQGSSGGTD